MREYNAFVVFTAEKDDQFSLAREQAQKEIEEAKAENVRMHQREADLRVCGNRIIETVNVSVYTDIQIDNNKLKEIAESSVDGGQPHTRPSQRD